ncbi:MAG: adenylate kinase [Anaerolineaceae bacterium]|nr:adenylate kinase [Anaerolineaceae bacterium]
MYIVMLGPPGAGKGTQAKKLAQELGLVHVSTGDLFRENLKNETELGKLAQTYMNAGELVPDDVTVRMVEDRFSRPDCAKGAVLDGFPRTPAQAQALDELLKKFDNQVKVVPYIKVPDDVLVERLSGRWMSQSGRVYHEKYNPPKVKWIDDVDGTPLYQREDDKPETVRHRIEVYNEQTAPLINYYQDKGLLAEIDGTQAIESVFADLMKAVEKK